MQKNNNGAESVCGVTNEPSEPEAGRGSSDTLRFELMSMETRDQTIRSNLTLHGLLGTSPTPEAATQAEFVDRVHTARMKEIIAEYGWPGHNLVGSEAAAAALLLLLHADKDIAFQKKCLPLLLRAIALGDALASQGAFLTDRICVNEGRPQWYGTQMKNANGTWVFADIENGEKVEEVNLRRASVGLPPLRTVV